MKGGREFTHCFIRRVVARRSHAICRLPSVVPFRLLAFTFPKKKAGVCVFGARRSLFQGQYTNKRSSLLSDRCSAFVISQCGEK